MILFADDWKKHPSAIIDLKTENKSAIRLALLYKEMGIKNYAFPLALHDPTLQGVDPFSNDLDANTINKITSEIIDNPWYFFREIIRVKSSGSINGTRIDLNRANIAYVWLCRNHVTTLLIQPRQTGKSLIADADTVWVGSTKVNVKMGLYTKDNSLRVKNIGAIKDLFETLPWYFNPITKSDSNNSENITINAYSNRLDTMVGQESEQGALKVGRGTTLPILRADEGPFIPNVDISLPVALAATGAARERAKAANSEYYNAFTTTPGYLNTKSGRYFKTIYDNCVRWDEKFYDCKDEEDLYETIKKNSKSGRVQILVEFNHRQLGKTDEWIRERILEAQITDKDRIEAEFFNKWSQGSATSPISKESREAINASKMEVKYTSISKEGYLTRWYIPESEVENNLGNRTLVMGLDSSELIGADGTNICIRDIVTGEVVGTGSYNDTNSITLSRFLAELLIKYPNITLVPETKSTGVSMVDNIIDIMFAKGHDPFRRIFNLVVNDMETNPEYKDFMNLSLRYKQDNYEPYRKLFGYRTSGSGRMSRDNLYSNTFNSSIRYTSDCVRDAEIIDQLLSLVNNNGRIDHPKGGHDDAVISWLLPYWFLVNGKNLSIYGIEHDQVLLKAKVQNTTDAGGISETLKRQKQLRIKEEINMLFLKLKQTMDPYIKQMIRNRLMVLYGHLEHEDVVAMNLEELLKSLKEEKMYANNATRYHYNYR